MLVKTSVSVNIGIAGGGTVIVLALAIPPCRKARRHKHTYSMRAAWKRAGEVLPDG